MSKRRMPEQKNKTLLLLETRLNATHLVAHLSIIPSVEANIEGSRISAIVIRADLSIRRNASPGLLMPSG